MKIGLCACFDTFNYGSELQSFATIQILKEFSNDIELIKYKKKKTPTFILSSLPRLFDSSFVKRRLKIYKNSIDRFIYKDYSYITANRNKYFKRFIEDNFNQYVDVCYGYSELKDKSKKYDTIIVGSDQLWLPSGMASNFYNLLFVPDDIKKISYATSFGVSSIPDSKKESTRVYLNRIDYISVREGAGKRIVDNLIGNKATVVLDPTLMLNSEQWDNYIGDRIIQEDYIFCYFLGNNAYYRNVINNFAKKHSLRVYNLAHIDEYVKSDCLFSNVQNTGPFEFVNLIKHAKYIFTDSFHGTVFSIIYKKNFLVFNRFSDSDSNSRNSRIDNITNLLGIEDRRYKDDIDIVIKKLDYTEIEKKLAIERDKSKKFLIKALEIENE